VTHPVPLRARASRVCFPLLAGPLAGLFLSVLGALGAGFDGRGEALIEAARRGDVPAVKELLARGADVDHRDRFGITAVWQATSKGNAEVVRVLLEAGADVNLPDATWHRTPLLMADEPALVTALVRAGASAVDAKLCGAAQRGQTEVVRAILAAGPVEAAWLARAREQARAGGATEIARLLEGAAKEALPALPEPSEALLRACAGTYVDERLGELRIVLARGRLHLAAGPGRLVPLVAIDEHLFECGSSRFRFRMEDGKVAALVQDDVFSERVFEPQRPSEPTAARVESTPGNEQEASIAARAHWPSFRGPGARGIAVDQGLPRAWSVESGEGIAWRVAVPGLANASPVVWGDRIFVTTAVSSAGNHELRIGLYGAGGAAGDDSPHTWRVLCLDHATGAVLWDRVAHEGVPPVKRHLKATQANSTPATDGEHVVALFSSGRLCCYDVRGKLRWKRDLGVLDAGAFNDPDVQWGYGASPVVAGDRVVVQCDLQEDSFLAAFDLETGEERWRVPRDEPPSWGTPTPYEGPEGPAILTTGSGFARGYDARTGEEIWRLGGHAHITVPTPFVAHDLIFVTSGYRPIQPIYAIRTSARGDITLKRSERTSDFVAWSHLRGGPYLPTPIVYEGHLYTLGNNGVLTCYRARSGERVYRERVGGGASGSFTASPVAADGRLYLTAESGAVFVVRAGAAFELLAENDLGEPCLATPAIAGGLFLARTQLHLVAVGKR